ncbi:MAG: tetratricopeptide repeat protein [Fimbriimonadaceae bacterium]
MRLVLATKFWLSAILVVQLAQIGFCDAKVQQAGQRTAPPEATKAITELYDIAFRYVNVGREAIEKGDYRAAERAARAGLAVVPDWPRLLQLQGEALIRLGNYPEALSVLTEANDKSKDQATYARIGFLLARVGRASESLRMANAGFVERILPKTLEGMYPVPTGTAGLEAYWLFAIGMIANEDDEATYYYTASEALDSSPIALNRLFGKIHLRNKRYAEAKESFDRVLSSSKDERLLRTTKRDRDMADARQRKAARLTGGGSVTGGG